MTRDVPTIQADSRGTGEEVEGLTPILKWWGRATGLTKMRPKTLDI